MRLNRRISLTATAMLIAASTAFGSAQVPPYAEPPAAIAGGPPAGSAVLPPRSGEDFQRHIDVVYKSTDDYELRCDVFVPGGQGPFPAILALHGGAWRFGGKWQLARQVRRFVREGFVVVAIQYRLAPRWKFPAQLEDGFAALQWIAEHADEYSIDLENLFGFGYSAGGHLISLLAVSDAEKWMRQPAREGTDLTVLDVAGSTFPRFRAVAIGGAPCDFQWIGADDDRLAYWLGGAPSQIPEVYNAATALDDVASSAPAFFLFHARDDWMVPLACSERMHEALRSHDVASELFVVEKSSHLAAFNDDEALDRIVQFFRGHAKLP